MATELVLIDGVWTLRTAAEDTANTGFSIANTIYGNYDYVAPTIGSNIEILNFVQLSASGSYT